VRTHGGPLADRREGGGAPEGLEGVPDGKRFAFVMTHDVETDVGRDRCRELMKIDQEFGIVSSSIFVPER